MNPHKGDTPLQADGKTYVLCYSHLALVRLEKLLDKGLVKIMREIDGWKTNPEEMRLGVVVSLLWAGLQKYQPEMTIDDTAELLDYVEGGVSGAIEVIGTAFQAAFEAPGSKGTNPQKEGNGTGMPSTSSMPRSDTSQTPSGT